MQHSERKLFTKKHPRNSLHPFFRSFFVPWTKATEVCLCRDSVLVLFALGHFCVGPLIFFSVLRAPGRINKWSTGKKILMWFMEKEIDLIYGLTILYFEFLISISLENRRSGFTLRYKLSQRSGFTILGYFYGHKIPTLIIQLNLWVLASFGAVGAVVKVSFDLCNAKQHNMSLNPNVFWRRGPGYWNIIRFSRDQKKVESGWRIFGGSSWSYCPFLLLWFTFQPFSSCTLGPGCSSASLLSPAQSKQWKDHIWSCDVEKK